MNETIGALTVYFDSPFWVGVFERIEDGKLSLGISSLLIAVLFNASFVYGWVYFNMRSVLELTVFLCGVIILRRSSVKETMLMIMIGIAVALLLRLVIPFHFW